MPWPGIFRPTRRASWRGRRTAITTRRRSGANWPQAGFERVAIETVTLPGRAASHRDPAIGFCQGTPMRAEIEALSPQGLAAATEAAAAALAAEFGSGPIEAPTQALIVVAEK